MARVFSKYGDVQVDYLFSGKDSEYFNMEMFGDYRSYPGLSFVADQGRIEYWKTLKRNNLWRFYRDVNRLDVNAYDLVLTDFEPISAWAARLAGKHCIGISHQNVFRYRVPVRGSNLFARAVLKWFAPADEYLGFHWHHYQQPILPPMIKTDLELTPVQADKILVYLPFLPLQKYHELFHQFPDYRFVQYHPVSQSSRQANIHSHPLSRTGFLNDFADCTGLISSAGFGACSEAIHYGKKLLVLPLNGQMEQLSNAAALEQLELATVHNELDRQTLDEWLKQPQRRRMVFPDVAHEIVEWLVNGRQQTIQQLADHCWDKVILQ
jgi:uncharacterized protein (TIGR00661 family)